jgi:hypothetical protein
MSRQREAIAEFWRVFEKHEGELTMLSSADHPLYDLILGKLHQIDPRLYFEFSSTPGASELIITADGNRSLFNLVESIVADAPKTPGWSISALKPKIGFPVAATWEGTKVTIADVVFEPLELNSAGDFGIRIFIPGITDESVKNAHNAILRALDHALGERAFAELVQGTEVLPLPDNVPAGTYLPLTELENFVSQRKKRQDEATS